MKLSKEQQKFIIEAESNSDVCQGWKTKIKEAFPKLFKEEEFKVGDWVYLDKNRESNRSKLEVGSCFRVGYTYRSLHSEIGNWIFTGKKDNGNGIADRNFRKATPQEIEEALIKEAKKRGFVKGCEWKSPTTRGHCTAHYLTSDSDYKYYKDKDILTVLDGTAYQKGQWAEIIPTKKEMTVKQLEKELGYEIKIVK